MLISPLRSKWADSTSRRSRDFPLARSASCKSCSLIWDRCISCHSISPSRTSVRACPLTTTPKRGERNTSADNSQCTSTSVRLAASTGKNGAFPVMARLTVEPKTMPSMTSSAVLFPHKALVAHPKHPDRDDKDNERPQRHVPDVKVFTLQLQAEPPS